LLAGFLGFDPTNRLVHNIRPAAKLQFLPNVCAMHLDRFDAQMKMVGDFSCRLALADELENFEFTIG